MFYSTYCLIINNSVKIHEKIISNHIGTNKILNLLKLRQLEITLKIPSKSQYEHGFITMLMLTEKLTNNFPIFLLDRNTLSKKKTIKIGLVLTIKNEMVNFYLKMCCIHSIPKFNLYGIFFNFSKKHNILSYDLNKVLSNTLFSFDKDINSYYDYLNDLPYEFNFLFRSYFKSILINKLILSNQAISFINDIDIFSYTYFNDIDALIALELLNELSDSDSYDFDTSDSDAFNSDTSDDDTSDDDISDSYVSELDMDDTLEDTILKQTNIFYFNNKLKNFFSENVII